ncbi:MAG: hypothetical protein ACRC42_03300 [Mycoplasma sp.]
MNFIDNQLNYFAKKNENSVLISNEELYAYLLSREASGEVISYEEIKWIISLVQQNTIIQSSFSMRREGMWNERERWLCSIQEGHLLLDWKRMEEVMKDKLELLFNENIYHQELKPTWKLNSFIGLLLNTGETYEDNTYLLHDLFIRRNKDEDFMEIRKLLQDYVVAVKKHVGTYKATINGQFIDYREFDQVMDEASSNTISNAVKESTPIEG